MKNTAINNSIVRSSCKPALNALQAILSIVSNGYIKLSISSLKAYLKEGRTAIKSRLSELKEIQDQMQPPANNFTLIPEDILLNPALSLSAKGIYMTIRSYATFAGFVIKKDYFYKKSGMYYKTFDRAWKELQTAGFLVAHQHRSPSGKFIYTYEMPEIENISQSEACTSAEQKEAMQDKPKTVIEITAEIARLHKALASRTTANSTAPAQEKPARQLSCEADPKMHRRLPGAATWYERDNKDPRFNYTPRDYSEEFLNQFIFVAE